MEEQVDRRSFLRMAGAGAAGAALLGRSLPALGASRAQGPNVLVIVLDSLRHDHVGAYGNSWIHTPNLDAFARESLRFTRGFPEAMPTVPARRSLVTGRRVYPWTSWRPTRSLPSTPGWTGIGTHEATWLKTLKARGYWTAYVTDNPFLGFTSAWDPLRRGVDRFVAIRGHAGARAQASSVSLDTVRHWLPVQMRDRRYMTGMRQFLANVDAARDEREQCCARVFDHGIDELLSAMRRRPFALVVDSFDPHEPWAPMQKYLDLYGDHPYTGVEPGDVRYERSSYLKPAELKRLPAVYAAAVTQADAWLGRFLDRFHASGLADETIVVLLSDHGIVLGERGWTGKPALELHPELTQVPFMLRDPGGRAAGATSDYFVSPHDVGPTVLSMAGVPAPGTMNGSDVSPLLAGAPPARPRPFWYGGYANHWYYRDDRWALIADGNNRGRELFDLRIDPGELHNVAAQHPHVLAQIYRSVLRDAHLHRLPYYGQAH